MKSNQNSNLMVSASPHLVSKVDTTKIMCMVIISLLPALAAAIYIFGLRALILTVVCMVSCIIFEYFFERITKKDITVGDLSAALTGLILALNLPVTLPYWMAVVGCFVAIVVVKQLFGGLGQNFANPAITARIVLVLSFTTQMTTWQDPAAGRIFSAADAITSATPLGVLSESGAEVAMSQFSTMQMFLGNIGGSLGEVSALALLIGGLFLIFMKVISPATPVAYLGTVAVFALLMGQNPLWHIFAGGVMLGAFFMATDYATTPITTAGKIVFGIGAGLLTMVIRLFGSYPEGVSFAILLMNICTPHIDTIFERRLYGGAKK